MIRIENIASCKREQFVDLLLARKASFSETLPTLVTCGEAKTFDKDCIRGHGFFFDSNEASGDQDDMEDGMIPTEDESSIKLYSSINGFVRSVNQLQYVEPLHSRYQAKNGDIVVGRVLEVGQGRWYLDVGAAQSAVLQLTAISLPTGEQRRKTDAEIVDMRRFFAEDDLVCTEVQKVNLDNTCLLHTRSARYGKLAKGCCVTVPPTLMMRLAQHMLTLPCGVHIILGQNGYVWVGSPPTTLPTDTLNFAEYSESRFQPVDLKLRRMIARVRNCILFLAQNSLMVAPVSIRAIYDASMLLNIPVSEICNDNQTVDILRHCLTEK